MAKKNVTFADIAAYTGFSKTTISRYFNNPDSITVENQEKIANALEILNYKENKLARVMANGKTEMVGVIIPNLYMHYYSDMLDHIISTYEKYGYKFIVFARKRRCRGRTAVHSGTSCLQNRGIDYLEPYAFF